MALAAATVYEVRTAGSDLNGGGFVTGASGTDYSQQNAAQYGFSDLVIDAATNTKVTSASHNFVATDVGNLINIASGTGFTTGLFQIVSVASNAATLDRSAGTLGSTGGVYKVGGALATPGMAMATLVAGQTIYAVGSSTTTSNTANIAGGRLNFNVTGTQTAFIRFIGYTSARGDGGKYTMTLGNTFTGPVITLNNANSYNQVQNLALVGNATSASAALNAGGRSNNVLNLKVSGFGAGGADVVTIQSNAYLKDFEISGGATSNNAALQVSTNALVMDGWVHGNAGRGVVTATMGGIIRVASAEHTGANGYGFHINAAINATFFECVEWNNAATGFFLANSSATATLIRCISGGGGGYNFDNLATAPDSMAFYYCAAKQNTTAVFHTTPNINVGQITLTGDPFTARTSGDFSPNNTAGAGAALRGVAETIFGLTTTYADTGPGQAQPAASVVASNYGFA